MTRNELITILLLDEVKAEFSRLGDTEADFGDNPLGITSAWLTSDSEDYVNVAYDCKCKDDLSNCSDTLIIAAILDQLKALAL